MFRTTIRRQHVVSLCLMLLVGRAAAAGPKASKQPAAPPKVVFNRDIRPVLSDNCFACHGPDKNRRQADLRLDQPNRAIAAGKPAVSELLHRINLAETASGHMPPTAFHKRLTTAQKQLITRWIAEGAKYQKHWSYEPPVKPAVPPNVNAVDFLVRKRLVEIGLKPSPEADRRTLIRRLSFDLLGLPPTPAETEAFVKDASSDAYQKLVERLLANPHYGERMAQGWLDVVRFADTIGYHSDNPRNIWPYRDYVIDAFNRNKPFDQFTREQLAGDLLPNPTQETRVGSAFNRLLLTTEEGGAQAKDYEARYLTDRVRAVGTVWLGQTTGCAQCHDHKFDPITTRDFYSLGAYFADIEEAIIGGREPGMPVLTPEQERERERLTARIDTLQAQYDAAARSLAPAQRAWEAALRSAQARWSVVVPRQATALGGTSLTVDDTGAVLAHGASPERNLYTVEAPVAGTVAGIRIEAPPDDTLPARGPGRAGNGNFVLTEVTAQIVHPGAAPRPIAFAQARATFEQSIITEGNPYRLWSAASTIDGDAKGAEWGWAVLPEVGRPQALVLTLRAPETLTPGDALQIALRQEHGTQHTLGKFRLATSGDPAALQGGAPLPPADVLAAVLIPAEQRSAEQAAKVDAFYRTVAPALSAPREELAAARKAREAFEASLPRCLVTVKNAAPRTVRILPRGNFLVETGEIVQPATPAFLPAQANGTRLDLANWLVSRENPLTARTIMNRLWKQFFGNGISKVLEDLGAQGEPPANPALLDWLACEFRDSGWDIKHMVRLMVGSATYRQVSTGDKALFARDPYNREYARQSRFRLEAEEVRDNALAIAGLLSLKIGGPSVKPYQPDRYWENLNFPVRDYIADRGENQYRRGLYTWWQRSFLHPSLLAFDAPSREECAADRGRSNIPQQALVLLNDPSYVEAARAFGLRIMAEGPASPRGRIAWAWRQALQRSPTAAELATVQQLYEKQKSAYAADRSAAEALIKTGYAPLPAGVDPIELAAWSHVARVLLNLHETITRS